jgi:F0F1-type ATP synthase beta subunit
MPDQNNGQNQNVGKVIEIKGVVIDAVFPERLPEIYSALRIERGDGEADLVAEVQQHLGDDRVRAVAMDATDGIPRGVDVIDTGAPITVPSARRRSGASGTCSASRSTRARSSRTTWSAGRSTATRRRSTRCSRRWRSSRPASR